MFLSWKGSLWKDTKKVWNLVLFSKRHFPPFLYKMLIAKISKIFKACLVWVFPSFILYDFSSNSVWCLALLWMHALLIWGQNSNIPEEPVYALYNLGQCLNVTVLDLVAVVVSLLTNCNIQTPSDQIFKEDMRLTKTVNYCLFNIIVTLIF